MPRANISIDLAHVLSSVAGRRVRIGEIITALGIGRSTYYEQRDDGRLLSADNLLRIAAVMDVNPAELLMQCGLLSPDAVADCAGKLESAPTPKRRLFQRRPEAPPL